MEKLLVAIALVAFVQCDVQDYLTQFGYFNPNAFDTADITESIKEFQATHGLAVTGEEDNDTMALMATPRCGRPDNEMIDFQFWSSKWNKNGLTYYYNNYTPDLYKSDVRELTERAFKFWSDVTPLTFTEEAFGDIVISFGSKRHHDGRRQCGTAFDGRGKVLAHAFYPPDGRLHFDEDEKFAKSRWRIGGINYLWVAVHELGHILGLSHDTVDKNAIMYPYYRSFNSNMKLGESDIRRIQEKYGRK